VRLQHQPLPLVIMVVSFEKKELATMTTMMAVKISAGTEPEFWFASGEDRMEAEMNLGIELLDVPVTDRDACNMGLVDPLRIDEYKLGFQALSLGHITWHITADAWYPETPRVEIVTGDLDKAMQYIRQASQAWRMALHVAVEGRVNYGVLPEWAELRKTLVIGEEFLPDDE
jgi:hypothetical protein